MIPAFGFGDADTLDQGVFPFKPDEVNNECAGFAEVLQKYRDLVGTVQFGSTVSFAPMIDKAISIVKATRTFHVLLIITDGQLPADNFSVKNTARAIVRASEYPLSIIVIGVGDGPFDQMSRFDDELPQRRFDNFQFVHMNEVYKITALLKKNQDDEFALATLMELPAQVRFCKEQQLAERMPIVSVTNREVYESLPALKHALRDAGFIHTNLIVGVDFHQSNRSSGAVTNDGFSLHRISQLNVNPYQRAIDLIGRTLAELDEDAKIPSYGFGDARTLDKAVFPFLPHVPKHECNGFEEVLQQYRECASTVQLGHSVSLAPIIDKAIQIVKESKSFHILLILTDGQLSDDNFSFKNTARAIVRASEFPLAIVAVGLGDGPFDYMTRFDDALPQRQFDNVCPFPCERVAFRAGVSGVPASLVSILVIDSAFYPLV